MKHGDFSVVSHEHGDMICLWYINVIFFYIANYHQNWDDLYPYWGKVIWHFQRDLCAIFLWTPIMATWPQKPWGAQHGLKLGS